MDPYRTTPQPVDPVAQQNAYKGLSVIFIHAVIIVNVFLIIKLVKRGRVLSQPPAFTILTLAGGDILVALFPLVVIARQWFDGYSDCEHRIISFLYLYWFLPFVYSTALISLCVELINRGTIRSKIPSSTLVSLALAAVPWCLALVVVLPMGLAGFESRGRNSYGSDRCEYDDPDMTQNRTRACFVVAAIVPSLLAVIATLSTSSVLDAPTSAESEADRDGLAKKEQKTLVIVALTNAAMTLPCAFFMVTEAGSLDPIPKAVFNDFFLWLLVLRSVVVPAIWFFKTPYPSNAAEMNHVHFQSTPSVAEIEPAQEKEQV